MYPAVILLLHGLIAPNLKKIWTSFVVVFSTFSDTILDGLFNFTFMQLADEMILEKSNMTTLKNTDMGTSLEQPIIDTEIIPMITESLLHHQDFLGRLTILTDGYIGWQLVQLAALSIGIGILSIMRYRLSVLFKAAGAMFVCITLYKLVMLCLCLHALHKSRGIIYGLLAFCYPGQPELMKCWARLANLTEGINEMEFIINTFALPYTNFSLLTHFGVAIFVLAIPLMRGC